MLIQGICLKNSFVVRPRQYPNYGDFHEHGKLTARVNANFIHVSGQGGKLPVNNSKTGCNMSIPSYFDDSPNGNMITRKIRQTVPEDGSSFLESETGQTEARVSFPKVTELLSNSLVEQSIDEHGRQRLVRSVERIDSVP